MDQDEEQKTKLQFKKKIDRSKTVLNFENSLKNLENSLNINKFHYMTYKDDRIKELNKSYMDFMNLEEYEKALNILKKIVFIDPNNHENFVLMGKIYLKIYDISSAISCFKKSLLIKQSQENSKTLEILMFAKGLIKLEDGRINKDFLHQFKDEINKTHYYYLKALAFLSLNNYNLAIKNLEKILKIESNHIEAIILLGKILIFLGRYKESSFFLWKAHYLQPDHSDVIKFVSIMKTKMYECLRFAHSYILKNKIDHALLWITKGLVLYPNHPECLLLKSSLHRKEGKYSEALKDLNEANKYMHIDNNTDAVLKQLSVTYNELSLYLINKKNYTDALKILEEALKFNKNEKSIHLNKGDCLREMKIYDKAYEAYMFCLNMDKDDDEVKERLSIIFYKYAIMNFNNKEYQECIRNLTSSIDYCNRSCDYYMLRARAYIKLKKLQCAYEDSLEALKLNPSHQDANEIKAFLSK